MMKSIFFVACIAAALAAPEADAKADADPYLTYGYNYPVATYAHSVAHPVATYAHSIAAPVATYAHAYSYPAYGYRAAYHALGKREAEAEADPAYLTYGYNYPV